MAERLQQQRALADARITAEQDGAARDAATAEDPIEFSNAGREPWCLEWLDLTERYGR
jgi:hypothetical protein